MSIRLLHNIVLLQKRIIEICRLMFCVLPLNFIDMLASSPKIYIYRERAVNKYILRF